VVFESLPAQLVEHLGAIFQEKHREIWLGC
jgi:hypothetical protein